jgi:5'-nucleotidase/UDP-sugar diphosphatase
MSVRGTLLLRLAQAPAIAALALACASATPPPAATPSTPSVATATVAAAPALPHLPEGPELKLSVVGFSDFHGWLVPLEPKGFTRFYGGLANIAAMLEHKERLDPRTSIVVDNGDMWTGPMESTLLKGESVVAAYNALGITAANVANHEFDFGQDVLEQRLSEARFPFLGANIVKAGSLEPAPLFKPYVIVDRGGVKVAIIGLSFQDTPRTTLAKHVAGLEFRPYAETLRRVVPAARAEGAVVVVVLFHDTVDEIKKCLESLPDLGITAVIAGQNHRKESASVHDTPIVNPGPFGRSYVRFDLVVDRVTKTLVSRGFELVDVTGEIAAPAFPPKPELLGLVESARQRAKALGGELVGQLARPLPVGTFDNTPVGQMIVDAWLDALPHADFAISNHGSLRQPLAAGDVTVGDVLGVLPFENNLFVVKLTGKQLKEELANDGPVVAGLTWKYREEPKKGRTVVSAADRLGRMIDDRKVYRVVINDFMYFGGDGFKFREHDADPEDTGLSLREPVLRALRAAAANAQPLDPPAGARAQKLR